MNRLPPSLRQVIAVALLLGAIGLIAGLTVLPLTDVIGALRTELAERRERLARLEAFVANSDRVEALQKQNEAAASAGTVLPGETDALRVAHLQALLTKLSENYGVRLLSSRILPAAEHDGLRFIGVQTEFDLTVMQLKDMIAALKSMRPYLFVQSLQIAPHDMHGKASPLLKVRLGIAGAAAASAPAEGSS